MTRFRLTVEYDGRPFMGWQRQAHGPSVQQAIEDAAATATGEAAILFAAGRTDAGVHALAMTAHVDIAKPITPFRLMEALNGLLNIGWSFLFFRLHRPDWALVEGVALWLSIAALILVCRRASRAAALLLIPYLAWVAFALVLNLAVIRLNGPFG